MTYDLLLPELLDLSGQIVLTDDTPLTGGGFADVWRGVWNTGTGQQQVAIKVLRSHMYKVEAQEKMKKRMSREIRLWRKLKHENVLQLYGTTRDIGSQTSMVSPWLDNGNLHSYLERHGDDLSLSARFKILLEVANGLYYLHSFSIVHGDLTPSNILMGNEDSPRLSDFGLSQIISEIHGNAYVTSTIGGAIRWAPIEFYHVDSDTDHPQVSIYSDTYSFGSVMFQTLSGQLPYHDLKREQQVLLKLVKGEKPKRPQENWIADENWSFICRCWAQPPQSRPKIDIIQTTLQAVIAAHQPALFPRRVSLSLDGTPNRGIQVPKGPRQSASKLFPRPKLVSPIATSDALNNTPISSQLVNQRPPRPNSLSTSDISDASTSASQISPPFAPLCPTWMRLPLNDTFGDATDPPLASRLLIPFLPPRRPKIQPLKLDIPIRESKREKRIDTSVALKQNHSSEVAVDKPASLVWSDGVLEELSPLSEGSSGDVHKVRDRRNHNIMVRKTFTMHHGLIKKLMKELSVISAPPHLNIVVLYGTYILPSPSEIKILMEYCVGGSLKAVGKRIKDRGARVSEKVTGRLANGILQGLVYLHKKKTIHRAIKPSNILLSRDGIVKLCDFGSSLELVNSACIAVEFMSNNIYMAPERISGDVYTIRSDVWSTGLSVLEFVQNRYPFLNDQGTMNLIIRIVQGPSPQLQDEPDVQWSDGLKNFIEQTLILDPVTRPTPEDMLMHPWLTDIMQREVDMALWMCQVWGWPKPS